MADTMTKRQRSRVMSRIGGKDTRPELRLRSLLHGLGYRYRLHDRRLPGSPDLVFPSRSKVIFMHGCFWHRHTCRRGRSTPSSRVEFWQAKLERNRLRDRRVRRQLRALGWDVMVVWECQLADLDRLEQRIRRFLG